jgi:hypothetical protein
MVQSDGQNDLILAETYSAAVAEHLRITREDNSDVPSFDWTEEDIEQVVLVGEVKNWPPRDAHRSPR